MNNIKNYKFNALWAWTIPDSKLILKLIENKTCVVHVCSGVSNIGNIRLDRCFVKMKPTRPWHLKYRSNPNIIGDMNNIPLKSTIADAVVYDPPYDFNYLNSNGYNNAIEEIIRITMVGGLIICISPWLFCHPALSLKEIIPKAINDKKSFCKLISIYIKSNGLIGDYVNGCVKTSACPKSPTPHYKCEALR